MLFEMVHNYFNTVEHFTEYNAPKWLTGVDNVKGSTMDNRWFFQDHILTLDLGCSKSTDFRTITRLK